MDKDFDYIAQFSDIHQLGHQESEFQLPGRDQSHTIKMGTLWHADIVKIKDRSARQTRQGDESTRQEIEVLETLVESIMEIDGVSFQSEDGNVHALLKGQLREILNAATPYTITHIYNKYVEIVTMSRQEIDRRIEEIKKSSGPSQTETPQVDIR